MAICLKRVPFEVQLMTFSLVSLIHVVTLVRVSVTNVSLADPLKLLTYMQLL